MIFKIVFSMCYAIESHTGLTDICKSHMRSASLIPFPLYFFDTELFCPSLDGNVHAFMLNCVRLFGTPWTVAHQAPSVHGNSQKRILEWVATSFSKRFSQSSDQIQVFCMSPAFQADSLPLSHGGSLWIVVYMRFFFFFWEIFLKQATFYCSRVGL